MRHDGIMMSGANADIVGKSSCAALPEFLDIVRAPCRTKSCPLRKFVQI